MAKFGEGDPRWLVRDLGDQGRNVNNWHWTEKDCMPWAKQRLEEVLVGLELAAGAEGRARVTQLKSVTGEAVVNNRKQKIIPIYELAVRCAWEGADAGGEEVTGELFFPYVSEENHDEDPELQITTAAGTSGPAAEKLRQAIRAQGHKAAIDAVNAFVKELRAGGPMRGGGSSSSASACGGQQQQEEDQQQEQNGGAAAAADGKPAAEAAKLAAAPTGAATAGKHSISLSHKFFASAADLYECFTDARRMMAYTRAPVEADARPGGALSLYAGAISASYLELQPSKRVVLDWRMKDWADGVNSRVTISIKEKDRGNTSVTIEQSGLPAEDRFGHHNVADSSKEGWERLLRQIKAVFGWGA